MWRDIGQESNPALVVYAGRVKQYIGSHTHKNIQNARFDDNSLLITPTLLIATAAIQKS